jgi:hypothetical protein
VMDGWMGCVIVDGWQLCGYGMCLDTVVEFWDEGALIFQHGMCCMACIAAD